jgi:hypothetical protein
MPCSFWNFDVRDRALSASTSAGEVTELGEGTWRAGGSRHFRRSAAQLGSGPGFRREDQGPPDPSILSPLVKSPPMPGRGLEDIDDDVHQVQTASLNELAAGEGAGDRTLT